MTLLYSYITDNLYISKLQPNNPLNALCIPACSRAGRRGRYWCDFTLHCTGLAATAATWDGCFSFVSSNLQFKGFKKHHGPAVLNAFDIRSMKHVGLPRVVFVPNISEYDLLIIAQVSRIKQVLEAEKIKPQETLTEDFMVEKGDTFLWPFLGGWEPWHTTQTYQNHICRYDLFKHTYCNIVQYYVLREHMCMYT